MSQKKKQSEIRWQAEKSVLPKFRFCGKQKKEFQSQNEPHISTGSATQPREPTGDNKKITSLWGVVVRVWGAGKSYKVIFVFSTTLSAFSVENANRDQTCQYFSVEFSTDTPLIEALNCPEVFLSSLTPRLVLSHVSRVLKDHKLGLIKNIK
jgi:hypothetical protein